MPGHDQPRGAHGKFTRKLSTAEIDGKAAALKEQQYTYQEIADELGLANRATAFRAVQRALKAATVPAANALRVREFARLEYLWECLQPGIDAGDAKSITEGRKVSESLRKLFRLDELEPDVPVDQAQANAVDALLAEAQKIVEREQAKIYGVAGG